jgi:hypothetical protein
VPPTETAKAGQRGTTQDTKQVVGTFEDKIEPIEKRRAESLLETGRDERTNDTRGTHPKKDLNIPTYRNGHLGN